MNVWEALTEAQKEELEKESQSLREWDREQRILIEKEARAKGQWKDSGLDTNQWLFSKHINEYKKRFRAIQVKYGFRTADE